MIPDLPEDSKLVLGFREGPDTADVKTGNNQLKFEDVVNIL